MNTKKIPYPLLAPVTLLLTVCLLLTSCLKFDSDYDKQIKIDDQKITKYLTDNNIQAQKNINGFYYKVITPNNTGKALSEDDVVSFNYTISLLNGTVLETNTQQGTKPAKFKLMSHAIIPEGLDYGINLMRVGEKYRFFVPSNMAYGSYFCTDFPENSNFIIDVEVVSSQTETQIDDIQLDSIQQYVNTKYPLDIPLNALAPKYEKYASGLYFIDSVPGSGNKPFNGDRVTFDFTRRYFNNSLIKNDSDVTINLGTGQAVQGLEDGLKLMKLGGAAILIMPSKIAFKQSLCVIPQKTRKKLLDDRLISSEVLPYSIVKYSVKLKSIY